MYCTRGSHCNMIFQHVGAKCFTLEEMVIQGPSFGYTSPYESCQTPNFLSVLLLNRSTGSRKVSYS